MSYKASSSLDVIYSASGPPGTALLGQLWMDTSVVPGNLYECINLSPLTYQLVSGGGGGGAPTTASYVTINAEAALSAERVLTAGAGITLTDNGPNSTVVIAATGGAGSVGPMGPQGFSGEDGEDGLSIPGPAGPQGIAGFAGPPGRDGEDGLSIPGPAGAAGAPGSPGAQGPAGMTIFLQPEDPEDPLIIPGPAGPQGPAGGGGGSVKQVTVTLTAPAMQSQSIVVSDATVTAASKIMLSLAGAGPTAVNEWDDIDLLDMMALPASGQFTFLARFLNPISGPLLINYTVG